MKKNFIKTLLLIPTTAAFLSGCESTKNQIGILMPVEHVALQAAADGFVEGLEASGLKKGKDFTIKLMNAGGKDADIVAYSKTLVAESKMTLGVGTGASKALLSASIDKGSTKPVLFTAVTDPVGERLVSSIANGSGFVTGTSDAQPIDAQIELLKECLPAADKIGIIYTQSETNSVVQATQAQAAAQALGLAVEVETCTGPSDISTAAAALCAKEGLDAIYIPTDNNIAANTNAVKQEANAKGILVITGEEGMCKTGGHVTLSINYRELGKITGQMAAQILKGEKQPGEIPVGTMTKEECEYVYSSANLAGSGITLPASVLAKSRDVNANA